MNIHHYMGAKIDAAAARKMGFSHGSSKGTKPARTHEGQKYPGGKHLRRALANRTRRIEGHQPGNCKRPDRIQSREDITPWGSFGLTKPGSMKA